MCRPLSDAEVEAIRKIIEQEGRRVWLYGAIRSYASWIAITLGAIALGYDSLVKAVKSLGSSG